MGKVYKKKKRSCAMCKPHKMGWAPKHPLKISFQEKDIEEGLIDLEEEKRDEKERDR